MPDSNGFQLALKIFMCVGQPFSSYSSPVSTGLTHCRCSIDICWRREERKEQGALTWSQDPDSSSGPGSCPGWVVVSLSREPPSHLSNWASTVSDFLDFETTFPCNSQVCFPETLVFFPAPLPGNAGALPRLRSSLSNQELPYIIPESTDGNQGLLSQQSTDTEKAP